jgi:hypothetical protein
MSQEASAQDLGDRQDGHREDGQDADAVLEPVSGAR